MTGAQPMSVTIGSVVLPNPVMTASGTAGHGDELHPYVDLSTLGAHVVKSLASFEWAGNPAPRLQPAGTGMINAVGLQGKGVAHWRRHDLPRLAATGGRVVVSIWGRSLDDFAEAARQLDGVGSPVVAVEINLSCPNLEGRRGIFAHDPELSAAVVDAVARCGLPRWAKLSANTDRVVEVAAAVSEAGAEAITLINTLLGLQLDAATGSPSLGAGGGGYSGAPIHPVAVRTVFDVHAALPNVALIGVGGVSTGWHAAELMLAGASAVQVGTAHFVDPRAAATVRDQLATLLRDRGHTARSVVGLAHRDGWRLPRK
jgi:dihydroorotate dehydrogenase (NAD+) catalytic subunit